MKTITEKIEELRKKDGGKRNLMEYVQEVLEAEGKIIVNKSADAEMIMKPLDYEGENDETTD